MRPKLRIPIETKQKPKWPYLHVVLPPDLITRVHAEADKRKISTGKLVTKLLDFALEHLSD